MSEEEAPKYPRSEVRVDVAGNVHRFVFRSKACAVIEEMMGEGLIHLFRDGKAGGPRFTTICIYAGKLTEKAGGKAKAWTYDSACRLLDHHQDGGGTWDELANEFFSCILENQLPELKKVMEEEIAAREAEEGYVEGQPITSAAPDPTSTLEAGA